MYNKDLMMAVKFALIEAAESVLCCRISQLSTFIVLVILAACSPFFCQTQASLLQETDTHTNWTKHETYVN